MEDIIILLKNYIQQHPRRYIPYITKNLSLHFKLLFCNIIKKMKRRVTQW